MKAVRILEIVLIPLGVAYAGWLAFLSTTHLIALLREYGTMDVVEIFRLIAYASASGFLAGIAGVITQAKQETGKRWRFYACFLLTVPIGAGLVFAYEATRPHVDSMFGVPTRALISDAPLWILPVCLWLPFLLLLRKPVPPKLPAEMLAAKTTAKEFGSADV